MKRFLKIVIALTETYILFLIIGKETASLKASSCTGDLRILLFHAIIAKIAFRKSQVHEQLFCVPYYLV